MAESTCGASASCQTARVLRGVIGAVCSVSLVVASACASESSNDGGASKITRERDDDLVVEAGSQAELPRAPDRTPPADGWRWESSLGIELAVPADWSVNDTGCGQTDAPTIVRGVGAELDCLTPEPPTKQIVKIDNGSGSFAERTSPPEALTTRDVSIDGVPAQIAEGHTSDGRAYGRLEISQLDVSVTARVLEDATLQRVFDSVHVVQVDHNGCATSRADMRATPPAAETFLPDEASALSICFVGQGDVLESSALIEGAEALTLIEQLSNAKHGMNADVPESRCLRTDDVPLPDVMLLAQGDSDRALVQVWFSGCTHRGMMNGRSTAQLTDTLLPAIMAPLHRGYGWQPFRN
jgi:hypothetical protein